MIKERKECEDCKSFNLHYADGFIFRDWSGKFVGDVSRLPKIPDKTMFYTYETCQKNVKARELKFVNLLGDCPAFEKVKS